MGKALGERQKAYVKKHKNEENYLAQRKGIMQSYWQKRKIKETSTEATLRKAKDAMRKKLSRDANKKKAVLAEVNVNQDKDYVSPSTVGKALKKVEMAMPRKEPAQLAVLKKLAKNLGVELATTAPAIIRRRIEPTVLDNVLAFYEHDEISRVDPGRKTAIVKRSGSGGFPKIKARRHLLFTISEVFNLYQAKFPDDQIKRSKFAEMRPSNVKPYRDIPHNVCVCRYHENFEALRACLASYIPGLCSSSEEFVKALVCDTKNDNCMSYECLLCKFKLSELFSEAAIEDTGVIVKHRQWNLINKRFEIEVVEETLEEAMDEFKMQLAPFLIHSYNQERSQNAFNVAKANVSNTSILLQVDFAENFTCHYQNEIQAAHWSNPQVSLFTGVIWYKDNDKEKIDSYAVASDNITHDRYCVNTFLRKILDAHLRKNPYVKTVRVFSDGAASQFKQRFNFANVTLLLEDLKLDQLKWTFFATSHGKGAVDGIGAVVKRHVWNQVRSNNKIVRNAETFASMCADLKTAVIFVNSNDIESSKLGLDKLWENVISVKGTQKIHEFIALSPYVILHSFYASATLEKFTQVNLRPVTREEDSDSEDFMEVVVEPDTNFENIIIEDLEIDIVEQVHSMPEVGQWVAVIYDEHWLPGSIETVDGATVEIKFMSCLTSNRFTWPAKEDRDTINYANILTPINGAPDLVSYSRHASYSLTSSEYQRIQDLYVSTL